MFAISGKNTTELIQQLNNKTSIFRINLEQFDLLKGRRGKCREDSFSISLDKPGNISSIQNICGDKTGLEGEKILTTKTTNN